MINKQPDIFDDRNLANVIQIVTNSSDNELICGALGILKYAALLHEINRQNIINTDIVKCLKPLIHRDESVSVNQWNVIHTYSTDFFSFTLKILKETCAVFRNLILDDDIRVEFSKAHDHARAIAAEILTDLTQLLNGMTISSYMTQE